MPVIADSSATVALPLPATPLPAKIHRPAWADWALGQLAASAEALRCGGGGEGDGGGGREGGGKVGEVGGGVHKLRRMRSRSFDALLTSLDGMGEESDSCVNMDIGGEHLKDCNSNQDRASWATKHRLKSNGGEFLIFSD